MPSIVIVVAWFGRWPDWLRFYLQSCRYNPTIQWAIITDCPTPYDLPPNVAIHHFEFEEYRTHVAKTLGLNVQWSSPYKLCDLKPTFADLHPDIVAGYDFWAFGDIDVIYGDIRSIYDAAVLEHDIVSSHENITAGHLTLVRNTPRLNASYRRIRGWRGLLSRPEHFSFDEYQWSYQFIDSPLIVTTEGWRREPVWQRLKRRARSPRLRVRSLFVEQCTTTLYPLPWIDGSTTYPQAWYWDEGVLTAEGAGNRTFLYCHFTHWQSSRWAGEAAWTRLERIDNLPPGRPRAFRIGPDGFTPWNEQ